ncbi:hypothetical protein D3C80_1258880 [compost metagenome]
MHGRQGQGVRHLDHGIDHLRQERSLHSWPADAFNARTAVQAQGTVTRLVAVEKHRALGIGAQHPSDVLAIAHIAA